MRRQYFITHFPCSTHKGNLAAGGGGGSDPSPPVAAVPVWPQGERQCYGGDAVCVCGVVGSGSRSCTTNLATRVLFLLTAATTSDDNLNQVLGLP